MSTPPGTVTSEAKHEGETEVSEIAPDIQKHYYDTERDGKFERDKASASAYWLGPVVRTYEIAEYEFLEYEETDFHSGPNYGTRTGRTRFSIYINGHDIGTSASSLDQALVVAVAYKRDGANSQAARFFWKATQPTERK